MPMETSQERMTAVAKREELCAYAQKLMDVGIEVVAHAHVEVGAKWAREPKVVALTLLCRTLGNMKGAISLVSQQLLVEVLVLTRCCVGVFSLHRCAWTERRHFRR